MSYTWHSKDPFENGSRLLKQSHLCFNWNTFIIIFVIHKNGPKEKNRPPITTNYRRCCWKNSTKRITSILRLGSVCGYFWVNTEWSEKKFKPAKRIQVDTLFISPVPNIRFLFFFSKLLIIIIIGQVVITILFRLLYSHLYLWILEKKAFFQLANVCHAMLLPKNWSSFLELLSRPLETFLVKKLNDGSNFH